MSDKIMMDGELLNVGDEVYCLWYGKGVVERILSGYNSLPVLVVFASNNACSYTQHFMQKASPTTRSLYRQKPEIIPPPKRKKRVKVWDWFVQFENGSIKRINGSEDYRYNIMFQSCVAQKIDGTEREIDV